MVDACNDGGEESRGWLLGDMGATVLLLEDNALNIETNLEGIFMGSDAIRMQLPEAATSVDQVHPFQNIMTQVPTVSTVCQAKKIYFCFT